LLKFDSLKQLRECGHIIDGDGARTTAVYEHIKSLMKNNLGNNLNLDFFDVDFEYYYGGSIYILEFYDDLIYLKTTKERDFKEWDGFQWTKTCKSILETDDIFEGAMLIPSKDFYSFWNVTNNAGGPIYYIPKNIGKTCKNLMKSLEKSN